ncbi:hypothetical protein C8R43DRAFT_1138578 [Mycena crocata]|nr:hypothetical protein C8R43DRAFT_1138578 [Mycena crocata]
MSVSFSTVVSAAISSPVADDSPANDPEILAFDVDTDLDAEENALAPPDDDGSIDTDCESDTSTLLNENVLVSDNIKNLAQAVNIQTSAGYKRLGRNFQLFLVRHNHIKPGEQVFTSNPPEEMPERIAAWILDSCDSIKLDGTTRSPEEVRLSYANAEKMRAAASWNFGQVENQGNKQWAKSEVTGLWVGNPSVSRLVSQYMTSLKRRKVQSGEVALSARALTPDMLERLYNYNTEQGRSLPKPFGAVKAHDIRKHPTKDNCIIITLPFRKTAQFGQIRPFYLYALPDEEAHLCPVRAYWNWTAASGIQNGYLFPKIGAGDRIITDKNEPMLAGDFSEIFRNHLLDIGIDPYPYGTHSFHHKGCQYLHLYRRWSLRNICSWGGWSIEFSSLTIVKYLISFCDDPASLSSPSSSPPASSSSSSSRPPRPHPISYYRCAGPNKPAPPAPATSDTHLMEALMHFFVLRLQLWNAARQPIEYK